MAFVLNFFVPGSGLIIRRREWLGFSLALLFGAAANVALAGWLVAPAAIPLRYTWLATILASFTWLLAQGLYVGRSTAMKRQRHEIEDLLRQAQAAIETGDSPSARSALARAMSLDHDFVKAHLQLSPLLATQDPLAESRES